MTRIKGKQRRELKRLIALEFILCFYSVTGTLCTADMPLKRLLPHNLLHLYLIYMTLNHYKMCSKRPHSCIIIMGMASRSGYYKSYLVTDTSTANDIFKIRLVNNPEARRTSQLFHQRKLHRNVSLGICDAVSSSH